MISLLLAATLGQFLGPTGGVDASPFKKKSNSPIVFSFTAPSAGAYASITPTVGGAISCSRASSGTYIDGTGTRQTAAANTCRVENAGLLVEGPSTNYLLNSGAPVTQTTASLATGSYTGWVEGTGSLAFTVGTAVATGLPCTATTGTANDCHFSITTAGTIVATVTGALTLEQLEPQPFRTSYIATTTTAAARSMDSVSATIPTLATPVSMSVTEVEKSSDTTLYHFLGALTGSTQTYGVANSVSLYRNNTTGALRVDVFDNAAAFSSFTANAAPTYVSHKYWLSAVSVAPSFKVDGVAVAGTATGTGLGTATGMTTLQLGGQGGNTGYALFGNISAACVAKTATGCAP